MQVAFGAGVLWGTPLTDVTGTAIANPTPVQFGALQDVSVDFSADVKKLFGSNSFPLVAARGKLSITGKAKAAQLNGALVNSIFFGMTKTAGILSDNYDTVGMAIPSTPYSITVGSAAADTTHQQLPNSGTWAADLGVRDSNGLPMTRVASGPTTGQYTVTAGVYLFAAADTGKTVYINSQYTATSTTAPKIAINNPVMGAAPTFRADLYMPYGGKQLVLTLNSCVATKLNLATKLDDFLIPEFDFEAFADSSGTNIGTFALSE